MLWFLPSNFQYKNALTCPVFLSIMLAVTFLIFPLFFQTHKATKGRVPSVQAPGLAFQHKWEIKIFHRGPIYLCSSETPKFNIFWAELKAFIISLCVCVCVHISFTLNIWKLYIITIPGYILTFSIYSKCTHELVCILEVLTSKLQ